MRITDWPLQERPRERLAAHGPGGLSDAELVAVCLRSGTRGRSAVDLARAWPASSLPTCRPCSR
jgi:DNA repair protein RadC